MGKFLMKWKKPKVSQVPRFEGEYKPLNKCNCEEEETEKKFIPRDVPKGHLVVYVGEEQRRFVIQIGFLQHPLFQELLDQAKQEYGFGHNSKLCIPCDEDVFHTILHCISDRQAPCCIHCPCL